MKHDHKKIKYETKAVPGPDAATMRELMARPWKPQASSLKREDWRRIVLERVG